jgi:nucleotidyltransferase/DNA polymerase involved in DNA repair
MDRPPPGPDAGGIPGGPGGPPGRVVGYLWVPHLPLAVALRRHPEATGRPTIVGGRPTSGDVVVDASDECLVAGVRLGQPLREAWECCPHAGFLPADPDALRRAQAALLDLVETVAVAVEDDGLGRVVFALGRPVDAQEGRWRLARLRTLVRARLGFRPRLALAPGRFAARVAAERDPLAAEASGVLVGDVAAYLAPLPLAVLPLPPRALERLQRLGLRTVGAFARLPRDGVGRRFGPEAVAAHRLAAGADERPLVPRRRPQLRRARHAFEPAVETLAPLRAVAERLLGELCQGLGAEGKTFRSLTVAVEREAGATTERTADLRRPTASAAASRPTLRALLEALARDGPVVAVTVTLTALGPAGGHPGDPPGSPGCPGGEQLPLPAGPAAEGRRRGPAVAPPGDRRRRWLGAATREVERRYPARLRRVVPSELPTLLDEHQFALLPYEPDDGQPVPPARPATARRVRVVRHLGRRYLVAGGRWDELVAVHGCWRAEEWWPAPLVRVYWRVRTRSGRVCTLSWDADGWRLVEVLD